MRYLISLYLYRTDIFRGYNGHWSIMSHLFDDNIGEPNRSSSSIIPTSQSNGRYTIFINWLNDNILLAINAEFRM